MTENDENDPKVKTLKSINPINMALPQDGFIAALVRYVIDNELIDLEGDWVNDVELIQPEANERHLGKLNLFESQMYALAMYSQEIIQDVVIDAQAQTAEAAAKLLRQHKHNADGETVMQTTVLTEDDRVYLNQLSMVFHLSRACYEFSARARFDCFDAMLTVGEGFNLYRITE